MPRDLRLARQDLALSALVAGLMAAIALGRAALGLRRCGRAPFHERPRLLLLQYAGDLLAAHTLLSETGQETYFGHAEIFARLEEIQATQADVVHLSLHAGAPMIIRCPRACGWWGWPMRAGRPGGRC
jgi:hypothetical protein